MKLYYFAGSPYSQKVWIALEEKGVEIEKRHVNLFDRGEMKRYKAIHPLGKLPLLVAGDEHIPESTIIVEFFEGHYPDQGTKLIPDDIDAARKVRSMNLMSDLYLVPPARDMYFQSLRADHKRDRAKIADAKKTLNIVYDFLEQNFQDNDWAHGDAFTLADCAIAPALIELAHYVYPIPSDKPALLGYLDKALQRPSIAQVQAEVEAMRAQGAPV